MGILSKFRFRWTKRQRLLFEAGIAILCVILFLGVLNTITYSQKVAILTTKDLMKQYYIVFSYKNSTTGASKIVRFNVSDVATMYGGYLYISLPKYDGYDVFDYFAFEPKNSALTFNDLVSKGLNTVELELEVLGSNTASLYNRSRFALELHSLGYGFILLVKQYFNGSIINVTQHIDLGKLVIDVTSSGLNNKPVNHIKFQLADKPYNDIDGFKVRLSLYAVSEKPVLKALSEPIYAMFSGLYAALMAFWRRFKTIVGSAFGGFSLSAIFTGLIGDPITAMVLSIAIVTILFMVMRKGR